MEVSQCSGKGIYCDNCQSHFANLRMGLTEIATTKPFEKDLKSVEEREAIVHQVLECDSENLHELHKFEMKIGENYIFRAKKDSVHILYSISKNKITFIRAIKNYGEYKRFLTNIRNLF